jgi:hypothetical protein
MTQQQTPAGWYPDPQMASTQRYWDGERWTEQVAPLPRPATATTQAANVFLLLVAAGAILLLVVVAGLLVN